MIDIKINKTKTLKVASKAISSNKTAELYVPKRIFVTEDKKSVFNISTILFAFMSASVFCYVFLVSSSIFYAVKESQFAYKIESIENTTQSQFANEEIKITANTNRISYINKNADTAISLK